MQDRVSILIIDDHWLSAYGLSNLVQNAFPGASIFICQSVSDANKWKDSHHFERLLILSDFWLRGGNALNVMDLFHGQLAQVKMIVISGDDQQLLVRKLSAAGVWGLIQKSAAPEQMLDLINKALMNAASSLGNVTHIKIDNTGNRKKSLLSMNAYELGLTPRQFDILFHVLLGRANKIIARELRIAEQTVKEHLTRILAHFRVNNRLELILFFANKGMTLDYENNLRIVNA